MNMPAVRWWLRMESLAILVFVLVAFGSLDGRWGWFALLFLTPDLVILLYGLGSGIGGFAYNLVHSYGSAAVLALVGMAGGGSLWVAAAFILTAHIAMDRLLGIGFKVPGGTFRDTHLGPAPGIRNPDDGES
jgi:hypothetical protein